MLAPGQGQTQGQVQGQRPLFSPQNPGRFILVRSSGSSNGPGTVYKMFRSPNATTTNNAQTILYRGQSPQSQGQGQGLVRVQVGQGQVGQVPGQATQLSGLVTPQKVGVGSSFNNTNNANSSSANVNVNGEGKGQGQGGMEVEEDSILGI
jgi:hypothetical protein